MRYVRRRIIGSRVPAGLDFVLAAVAARVVGGGVVVQAIGHDSITLPPSPLRARLIAWSHRLAHRDEVVAVHLQAVQAGGDALLRQRLGAGLRLARHRDRPAVVDHAQHQRQLYAPAELIAP